MSLTDAERDAAFILYSLGYSGAPLYYPLPKIDDGLCGAIDAPILAAAIALGAEGRMWDERRKSRAEVAAAVEAALGEEGETEAPVDASADITLARLEAYAEGAECTLEALERELTKYSGGDAWIVDWIGAHRAAGPKQGMTAREVLDRIGTWNRDTKNEADGDCPDLFALEAKLRAEIEGGTHG